MQTIDPQSPEISWQTGGRCHYPNDACVQAEEHNGQVLLRESATPDTAIATTPEKLRLFIDSIKDGDFDHLTA